MAAQQQVKWGGKTFLITSAHWNSGEQIAEIEFEDDNGIVAKTTAWGMSPAEQRQAVIDEILEQVRSLGGVAHV